MIDVLRAELTADPLARNYASMTPAQAAASLNQGNRTRIRRVMSGDEVFQQTNATEWGDLTDAKRQMWVSFCSRQNIDPAAAANVAFVQFIFGTNSATVTALGAARQESISRATELGLERVEPGHVMEVRRG